MVGEGWWLWGRGMGRKRKKGEGGEVKGRRRDGEAVWFFRSGWLVPTLLLFFFLQL